MAAGLQRLTKIVALVAASLMLVSISADTALAVSRICRQLEAELASASGGGRSSAQIRKHDSAIAKQRDQLQLAKKQARRSGCGFSLFGGGVAKCGAINAKIERMERNLDALQRKRAERAVGGSARSRTRIMAALDANGCRDQELAERPLPRGIDRNQSLLDQIFGGGIRQIEPDDTYEDGVYDDGAERNVRRLFDPLDGTLTDSEGNQGLVEQPKDYRTLCVRMCDGYFFPMSGASSLGDFDRDQKNCESACPGAGVQVFYHKAVGEESADMISSVSGAPYSELPTAYLYKQSGTPRPQSCGCNQPRNFEIIAGNPPPAEVQSEPVIPVPVSRPDPAADPETLANADGGLDPETIRRMAVAPETKTGATGGADKKVRVVGPVFLPDPEAAIDLRAPAQKQVR